MNWDKITKDEKVKQLLIDRAYIEEEIKRLDENALIMYELEVLSIPDVVGLNEQLSCGRTFTIDDMKKAFMAGADKKYWTKIYLTGVVSGRDYVLEPVFEKWFEYYR